MKKLLILTVLLTVAVHVHATLGDDMKKMAFDAKQKISWGDTLQEYTPPAPSVSSANLGGKERSAMSPFYANRLAKAAERRAANAASRLVEDTTQTIADEAALSVASDVAQQATQAAAETAAQLVGDTAKTVADEASLLAAEEAYNAAQAAQGTGWFQNLSSYIPTKESLGNAWESTKGAFSQENFGNKWQAAKEKLYSAKDTLSSTEKIKAALTPKNMRITPEGLAFTQEVAAEAGMEFTPNYNPSWGAIARQRAQDLKATCTKKFWDGHQWVTENPELAIGAVGLVGLGYLAYRAYTAWERQIQRAVSNKNATALDEILAKASETLTNDEFNALVNVAYTAALRASSENILFYLRTLAAAREISLTEPVVAEPIVPKAAPVGGGWRAWIPSRPSWLGGASADVEQMPVDTTQELKDVIAADLEPAVEPKPQYNPAEQQLTLGDAINREYVGAVESALRTLFATHYADYNTNPETRKIALNRLDSAQKQASRLPESPDKESIQGLITQYTEMIQNTADEAAANN